MLLLRMRGYEMIYSVKFVDPDHKFVRRSTNPTECIPVDSSNREYRKIVRDGKSIADYEPPEPTKEDVRQFAQQQLELLVAPYERGERETWATQVQEAQAFEADKLTATPFLAVRAAARETSVTDLVDVVLSKDLEYRQATAAILGAMDQILAMDPIPGDFQASGLWPQIRSAVNS
jgi:hypothetical protein